MIHFSQPLVLLSLPLLFLLLRWARRRTHGLTFLMRGAALFLIILALASPQLSSRLRESYIYFLVDLSGSIARPREELLGLVDSFMVDLEHLRYGLILFGAEAALDQGFTSRLDLEGISTVVPLEGTDLSAALELALAGFPKEGGKGIVLLSDGLPTQGEVREPLARAVSAGVKIFVLPLRPPRGEVWVEALALPEEVPPGAEFELDLTLGALESGSGETSVPARLLLYRDERLLQVEEVRLAPGPNRFLFRDRLAGAGFHRYRVEVVAPQDMILENNSLEGATVVRGGPRVLLVRDRPGGSTSKLLEAGGYEYRRASPAELTWEALELAAYRLVILDNLELAFLDERALTALEGYVSGGGGLLVIQGQRAVTGLRQTGLERLLPVSYEGREPAQAPSLAIVFVLDRSASMMGKKILFLKEAAAASVEILEEGDRIGLLAFDVDHHWLVPIRRAEEEGKELIYRKLAALKAEGGTDLLPALREAFHSLREVEARLKHILVFSDGKALPHEQEFPLLLEELEGAKITVSAIAIGEDADVDFLRGLTEATGGKLYQVKDPRDLPRVTLKETERITRQRWVIGEIEVIPGPAAYLLRPGLGPEPIPSIGGYVVTYSKETGEMALLTEGEDPLIGLWSYGLGRVGVINTDLEGRWSAGWLEWEEFPGLFSSVVRRTYGRPVEGELAITTEISGPEPSLRVIAEVTTGAGRRWANLLAVRGVLAGAGPEGEGEAPREFSLEQTAPGRYEATLEGLRPGAYLLSVSAVRDGEGEGEEEIATRTEPLTIPYPEEYRRLGTDELLLEELAASTGGGFLDPGEGEPLPEELLRGGLVRKVRELRSVMLLLALFICVAELILRKFT